MKYLQQQREIIEKAILEKLIRLGEYFVANARNNDTYKDHTGNLRSSIGYIIFKNGGVVFESFPGSNSIAVEAAKIKAMEIYKQLGRARGFVFIGIAGMEYAAAVEAKGYDVITGSSLIAKDALKKSMKELSQKINKA